MGRGSAIVVLDACGLTLVVCLVFLLVLHLQHYKKVVGALMKHIKSTNPKVRLHMLYGISSLARFCTSSDYGECSWHVSPQLNQLNSSCR